MSFQKGHSFSSRSRYDHFDTSPYMSARHFSQPFSDEKGLWKELTERTANLFNFRTVENPHGYRVFGGRNGQLPARFRVSPVMTTSIPLRVFIFTSALKNTSEKGENWWRELRDIHFSMIAEKPRKIKAFQRWASKKVIRFRVSPVMTTSIPLRIKFF